MAKKSNADTVQAGSHLTKDNGKPKPKRTAARNYMLTVSDVELSNGHWEQLTMVSWEYVVTVTALVTAPTDPPGANWSLVQSNNQNCVKAKLEKSISGNWVTAIPLTLMDHVGNGVYEKTIRGNETSVPQNKTIQGVVIAEWSCAAFAESDDSDNINSGTHA